MNRFIYGLASITVETCMVTYLIIETWPYVNVSRLAFGGGINNFYLYYITNCVVMRDPPRVSWTFINVHLMLFLSGYN